MSLVLGESLRLWLPELLLSVGAMGVLLTGVFAKRPAAATVITWLVLAGCAVSVWATPAPANPSLFFGLIVVDSLAMVFRWLALGVVALVALMATTSSDVARTWRGEYLSLFLCVGVGLMLMAEANHLLMAYLAMELVSLTSYVLVAFSRDARSSEAALKYLLFGALSSGIMLFGMSLLFGMTGGALAFPALQEAVGRLTHQQVQACVVPVALLVAGLAFKISMVPFHMWTPDVYEGAPVPVTAMLSVGPKAAGLALLLRIAGALSPMWPAVAPVFFVLTIVTMTLGNVAALVQQNVKRLLAYSTIGQVGYLLIGFSVRTSVGVEGMLVYLVAYLFMNLGAFACVVAVCNDAQDESLDAFRGLARRAPGWALGLAVFLLSLAGLPPLVGFIGKFLLFGAALQASQAVLAIAAVLNSAVALYYYVNIIRQMYLLEPRRAAALRPALSLRVALGVCGLATVALGLFPSGLLAWLSRVADANLL